ncbi:MFS general substrate transporter [Ramaria rubella]|nr:MFS general substrate transporter [Ramaria rubella]
MSHENTRLLGDEECNLGGRTTTSKNQSPNHQTPLPWRTLSTLLLLVAVYPLAFQVIFPFVNQMILVIGVDPDPERVGFYSGLIESIFSLLSFITIIPSSYLSDQIGRKPVILWGMMGLAISIASFGMSKTFLAMVLSRCIGGALGGVWTCTKIMIGEQSDRSNQARAFQWMGIAYRLGQIVGHSLGGFLAHPARTFSFFQTKFWYEYPFALPCFFASAFAFFSVIIGCFTLQETLPMKTKRVENKAIYGTMALLPDGTAGGDPTDIPLSRSTKLDGPSVKSILTLTTVSILVSNIAMCLIATAVFAMFPLFAFTPIESGGLGMNEAAIGTLLSLCGILQIIMMSLYVPLEQRFGSASRMYHGMMCMWPLTVLFMPFLNYLLKRDGEINLTFKFVMFLFFVCWGASGYSWISMSIMVMNAVPSSSSLATINGLSQMTVTFSQAIAPGAASSLFAFSINSGIVGGNLIWIIFFAFTCAAALHSASLKESASDWRDMDESENDLS